MIKKQIKKQKSDSCDALFEYVQKVEAERQLIRFKNKKRIAIAINVISIPFHFFWITALIYFTNIGEKISYGEFVFLFGFGTALFLGILGVQILLTSLSFPLEYQGDDDNE